MVKKQRTLEKIRDDVRSAGQGFIGFYMEDLIKRVDELENQDSKKKLIEEYFKNQVVTKDTKIGGTTTRVNAVKRIIEADEIVYVLKLIDGSDKRVAQTAVEKAKDTLYKIEQGLLELPELF